MSLLLGTSLLAVVTAVACALPGVFVVLRRQSMIVDAISHAVLPGIVVGFLITHRLDSPLLVLGAALAGVLVVLGNEYLTSTGVLTGDAPQGLIFPALFSIGVILVSVDLSHVHLDTHAVLVGDLNLAAFAQWEVAGHGLGPVYLYLMLGVLLLNAAFLTVGYRVLKVTTFDAPFARSIGIGSSRWGAALMFLVSLTVTAAFHAAGAVLVIALMVVPPATAYLLTTRLPVLLLLTVVIAATGALAGFWVAYVLDAATSAGMAVCFGLLFGVAVGVARWRDRRRAMSATTPAPALT